MPTVQNMLREWNARYSERAKLQHVYVIAGLLGIVLAGLVGLIDYDTSRALLRFCFGALGIFLVNAIVWALLFSLVISKLPAPLTSETRKPKESARKGRSA
jgi:hypothetical protein